MCGINGHSCIIMSFYLLSFLFFFYIIFFVFDFVFG